MFIHLEDGPIAWRAGSTDRQDLKDGSEFEAIVQLLDEMLYKKPGSVRKLRVTEVDPESRIVHAVVP